MAKNISKNSDEKEKKESLDVFKGDLVNILDMNQSDDRDIIEIYNIALIRIMLEDKRFQQDLTRALRDNQEKLTAKEFILNNKPTRPTVANWLKDFIAQHGAIIFNNVKLSQYLTEAKNVKILDEVEKNLVRKLLLLYRNLSFFPDSMKEVKVGDWEIIPIEKEEKFTKVRKQGISNKAQVTSDRVHPADTVDQTEKSKEVINPKIAELQKMAEQYPSGSLERRAVDEEIKKIIK